MDSDPDKWCSVNRAFFVCLFVVVFSPSTSHCNLGGSLMELEQSSWSRAGDQGGS